jgi:hypothetical protein
MLGSLVKNILRITPQVKILFQVLIIVAEILFIGLHSMIRKIEFIHMVIVVPIDADDSVGHTLFDIGLLGRVLVLLLLGALS